MFSEVLVAFVAFGAMLAITIVGYVVAASSGRRLESSPQRSAGPTAMPNSPRYDTRPINA